MTYEAFRYCWIKVTDEEARVACMRSALDLQQQLMDRAREVTPGSVEARAVEEQLQMARCYLGEDVDHGVRVVIIAQNEAMTLQVLAAAPQTADGSVEIALADMPPGFSREQAEAWIDTPVGATWSHGALARRLIYAAASVEQEQPMVAPALRGVNASCPISS